MAARPSRSRLSAAAHRGPGQLVRRRSVFALIAGAGAVFGGHAFPWSTPETSSVGVSQAAPDGPTVVVAGYTADAPQSALQSAGAFGDVYLPEGIYMLDRTITIDEDGVSLRGARAGTVLQARSAAFNLLYLHNRTNVTIRDLSIVGAGSDGAGGIGILADACIGCTFQALSVQSCGSSDASGIHLRDTRFSRISKSSFVGNGRGIHLYHNASNNIIDWCTGAGNAKEMIFLTEGCTDCIITGCTSENDGRTGAAVSIAIHRSDRSVLSGSEVRRSGQEQGVEIAAGDDNVVANCTIADSNWAGLHIVNAQRTIVAGNLISGNKQAGILLRSAGDSSESRPADGCVISGNVIEGNNPDGRPLAEAGWSAIELERGSNVRIERNFLRDNHATAIHIAAGNRATNVQNNVFQGAHSALLVDEGTASSSDIPLS
jgi:parallel beta-helix repeat protein